MTISESTPTSISLTSIGERLENCIAEELGPPILGLSCRINWTHHDHAADYPRGIAGSIFHDCSEISFDIGFGHIRIDAAILEDPLSRLIGRIPEAANMIKQHRSGIRARAATVLFTDLASRKAKGDAPNAALGSPFVKVAASCLKKKTSVRLTPDWCRAKVETDRVESDIRGVNLSLAARDLRLQRHKEKMEVELAEECVSIHSPIPQTVQRASIGKPLSTLIELPGLDLIEAEIRQIERSGTRGHKISIRSPMLNYGEMLRLAREIDVTHRKARSRTADEATPGKLCLS